MSILTGKEIVEHGIVQGFPDLDAAVQPCGVDVSLGSIEYPLTRGALGTVSKVLPEFGDLQGTAILRPEQAYLVRLNEQFRIPDDVVGMMYPRSTMLRMGADVRTAVWDPGYTGRGQVLLVVHNPLGIELYKNTRIAQVVFHRIGQETDGYDGSYQGEGLGD